MRIALMLGSTCLALLYFAPDWHEGTTTALVVVGGEGPNSLAQGSARHRVHSESTGENRTPAAADSILQSASSGNEIDEPADSAPESALECVVQDEYGNALPDAIVEVRSSGAGVVSGQTNQSGRCSFDRPHPHEGLVSVHARKVGRLSVAKELRIGLDELNFVLPTQIEWRGRVRDSDALTGILEALVVVQFEGSELITNRAHTDRSGVFGPLDIPASTPILVHIMADGYSDTIQLYHSKDAGGDHDEEAVFLLTAATDLACRIYDAKTLRPIAGAAASPIKAMGRTWLSDSRGILAAAGMVSARGNSAAFLVKAPGYCPVTVTGLSNPPGLGLYLDVPLFRENIVRLKLMDASGAPSGEASIRFELVGLEVMHGMIPVDRSVAHWPDYLWWDVPSGKSRRGIRANIDGVVLIEGLPPGLGGLDVYLEGTAGHKKLCAVAAFLSCGEVRDLVARLPE